MYSGSGSHEYGVLFDDDYITRCTWDSYLQRIDGHE